MSKHTLSEAAVPAAPPAAVSGLSLAGIPLSEWVYIITIVYTLIVAARAIWKWRNEWKDRNASKRE